MGTKNEYAIDLLLNIQETQRPDCFYYLMQWSMAYRVDQGTWTQVAVADRGNGDYGFGTVSLTGATLGLSSGDEVTFSVFCSNNLGTTTSDLQKINWIRMCFRPAYDVLPGASNLKTSPFGSSDTDDMLQGIDLSTKTPVSEYSAGFQATYPSSLTSVEQYIGNKKPFALAHIPSGTTTFDYEFTAYVEAVDGAGNVKCFKTDPELITGKRGGG